MFQEATLMPHLTVRENIELPLKIKGSNSPQKIAELIKAVGLEEYANYLPQQLSGGMKTRVALARAFVTEPELLLLDEPFSALDIGWKSDLYKRLVSLFHTTLVIVTHDVQEAILLADEIIVLNRKGSIETKYPVNSALNITDRVNDIAGFVKKEVFNDLFAPLQRSIITDVARKVNDNSSLKEIIKTIKDSAGNIEQENSFNADLINSIREDANSSYINNILIDSFNKAKSDTFKYISFFGTYLNIPTSNEAHQQFFEFYLDNIALFSNMSKQWYKTQTDEAFFQTLKGRIGNSKKAITKRKVDIYLR
ncbi:MAG: ATP-binding cassette domain-containing protein [Saprospiraceae bacterium]|nr:ATP-binding cassette domain-containing protein [Saprospiraceae bacterium]